MNPENFDSRRESHRAPNRSSHQRSHSNPENESAFRMQTISRENHMNPRNPFPLYQMLADNNEEYKENPHQMRQLDGERDNRGELEIRGLNEEFNNLQIRKSKRNPTSNFPRENQMRGFLQYYQQEFPLDFGKLQENMHHEAQQSDARNCLESMYKMRKVPKPVARNVLPYEPFMKLTVLRTSFEKHLVMEYHVTPRGMINTNRNTDHDDIMIGRQQATPEGVIPNDICLFYSDRAISRVHAKIITKYGFNTPREIPSNFIAFLMMSHKRLGAQSIGYKIPEGIYRHIFSFIKEPKKFWLVDLGSSFGTYIKLTAGLHPLEKGQTYLVGLDTYFNIVDVKNNLQREGRINECEGERSTREQEEFMKFLFQERVYNKCEIHGLSDLEEEMLEFKISSHKDLLYEEDNNFLETERCLPSFKRPYLKIEVHNYGGFHSTPNHILIGNPQNEFTVGRMQECDVNLTQNTAISRKQCRFTCNEGIWYIADGIDSKKSANGTWVSLTDYRLKRERVESEPRAIENGTEIKINDTVLQVEIFNNS